MRSKLLVAPLALFALLVGSSSDARATNRSAGQPLSAILERALANGHAAKEPAFARCEESFKYYLDEAARAVTGGQGNSAGVTGELLWVVGEGGGMSTTTVVRASQSGATEVIFNGEDFAETGQLTAEETRNFKQAWLKVMTGDMREVRDIADGSCTLVSDGHRARIFQPGYGVPSESGDALQSVFTILDSSQHR